MGGLSGVGAYCFLHLGRSEKKSTLILKDGVNKEATDQKTEVDPLEDPVLFTESEERFSSNMPR